MNFKAPDRKEDRGVSKGVVRRRRMGVMGAAGHSLARTSHRSGNIRLNNVVRR
jgi:hypothetical protein